MQTLNNAELAFLSVLAHPELTKRVLRIYADKTYLFTPLFNPHLNVMWDAYVGLLTKYREKYGLSLSPDIVAAGLAEAVEGDNRITEELRQRSDTLLQKLVSKDVPDVAHGSQLIRNLMALDANRRIAAKLNENADMIALQQTLDASKRTLKLMDDAKPDESQVGNVFNPLRDIRKLARKSVRIPTGINWMDDISGGGGREGDLWLVLGAPASGKSIMAVQYSCGQALIGNNVLWATYEQTLEGDIAERMIANITDTSLDQIRDVGFDNLPQDIQDRFWASVGGVDDRLTAMDMTSVQPDPQDPEDYGGVYTLWKQVKQLKADGHAPKTLVLDWFGSMMSRIASNLGLDLAACYRFKAQEEILKLQKMAREEKMLVIVFHQLDAKAAGARPTYLADATHAQDMHNMQNFFDLVAIIGIKDVNNICYFSNPKARKGGRVVRTLHMIGEKSKFVMEDGWLPNSDGNFYRPGSTGQNVDMRGTAEKYSREID